MESKKLHGRVWAAVALLMVSAACAVRPHPAENEHGAWYWKTRIEGAPEGKLAGKTIALKDNICLAGVPMMNGASILEGYVPEIDATVVTRILEAGGTIVGKTVCE